MVYPPIALSLHTHERATCVAVTTMLLLRPSCYPGAPPAPTISCTKAARLSVERWAKGMVKRSAVVEDLPHEVMEQILELLFLSWRLATRTLRVSVAFAALAQKVSNNLPRGEWCRPAVFP